MTANELADAIEKGGKDGFFQEEIVAILRQQQAEIEALRKELKRYADAIGEERGKTQFVHDYSSPFIELQKARE
jgi:hypothetical protein